MSMNKALKGALESIRDALDDILLEEEELESEEELWDDGDDEEEDELCKCDCEVVDRTPVEVEDGYMTRAAYTNMLQKMLPNKKKADAEDIRDANKYRMLRKIMNRMDGVCDDEDF